MTLTIDIGNTRTKVGIFKDGQLQKVDIVEDLLLVVQDLNPKALIISSTKHLDTDQLQTIRQLVPCCVLLDHHTPLPIRNLYETPETLGMDRLAAIVGASHLYPRTACLVVDLGTCITYDFIDQHANYHGGSIAPGIKMRLQAMHHFTDKLPLWEPNPQNVDILGKTTKDAMISGAINGVWAEITQYQSTLQQRFSTVQTLLTGGDSLYFEKNIKKYNFAHQNNIVHIGLHSILSYHVKNI